MIWLFLVSIELGYEGGDGKPPHNILHLRSLKDKPQLHSVTEKKLFCFLSDKSPNTKPISLQFKNIFIVYPDINWPIKDKHSQSLLHHSLSLFNNIIILSYIWSFWLFFVDWCLADSSFFDAATNFFYSLHIWFLSFFNFCLCIWMGHSTGHQSF